MRFPGSANDFARGFARAVAWSVAITAMVGCALPAAAADEPDAAAFANPLLSSGPDPWILLVGGFAFVLAAIVYQASRTKQDVAAPLPADIAASPIIDLPVGQGADLTAMSLDGNRLALHLKGPDGREIVAV